MKYKIGKVFLVIILLFIILFSMCSSVFATNGNEINISSKTGIGSTIEIVSGNTTNIKSESVADIVSYLTGQNITVNSITNHKGASLELTSTALIGTGYVLDTNNGTYSAIVYGDANGDGEADAGDMKVIIDNFLGIQQASPIAKVAVDLYQDGDLDAADLKQVLDSFLGNLTGSILRTTSASNPTPTPDISATPTPTPVPSTVESNVEMKIGGETVSLTKENAANYYGYIVTDYTAGNATWRLFYVDFDGKYGEPGKIYLKADSVNMNNVLGRRTLDAEASVNSIEALNKMKEMNPQWAIHDGIADLDNETPVLWLCDDSKWSRFKDTNKADYAMGAPSLEMYIDSYNAYHSKKLTNGFEQIKCKWFNENGGGYKIRNAIGNESNYVTYKDLNKESDIMYMHSTTWVWLASPSAREQYNDNHYICISYDDLSLGTGTNSDSFGQSGISPVVSLKSDYIPQLKYDSASNMKLKFITCWNNNSAIRTGTKLDVYINNKYYSVITALDTNGEATLYHTLQEGKNEIKIKTYYSYFGDYLGYDTYRTINVIKNGNNVYTTTESTACFTSSYDQEENEMTIYVMFRTR